MDTTTSRPGTLPFPPINDVVAEATMHLPPMIRSQDTAFLRAMTEVTIDAFWQLFIGKCSPEAIAAFHAAENQLLDLEAPNTMPFVEWFETNANFGIDPSADQKAAEVMEDLRSKLPGIFQREYPLFSPDDALAA